MASSARFTSRFPLTRTLVVEAVERALVATGNDIVDATKARMVEGNFFWSGLSRDADTTGPASDADKARAEQEAGPNVGTVLEHIGPHTYQVHIKTPWAAYAEFGTSSREPHPALTPAIADCWPDRLFEHAAEELK